MDFSESQTAGMTDGFRPARKWRLLGFFQSPSRMVRFEKGDNRSFRRVIIDPKLESVALDGEDTAFGNLETQPEGTLFVMEHLHGFAANVTNRLARDVASINCHAKLYLRIVG
jgi:hypothetical protein